MSTWRPSTPVSAGSAELPFVFKELLYYFAAFCFQQARHIFNPVIKLWCFKKFLRTNDCPGLWLGSTKIYLLNARVHNSTGTHGTWLDRDVKITIHQATVKI